MTNFRPHFDKCPLCGSRKIALVEGPYHTTTKGKAIVVPRVRRHECAGCGEVFLDYDAMDAVEAAKLSVNKRQPARRKAS